MDCVELHKPVLKRSFRPRNERKRGRRTPYLPICARTYRAVPSAPPTSRELLGQSISLHAGKGSFDSMDAWFRETSTPLRVCDVFEVAKHRCCKPSGYDDQIVENSKKSQTLRMTSLSSARTRPHSSHLHTRSRFCWRWSAVFSLRRWPWGGYRLRHFARIGLGGKLRWVRIGHRSQRSCARLSRIALHKRYRGRWKGCGGGAFRLYRSQPERQPSDYS
jgi:hypothetical protein